MDICSQYKVKIWTSSHGMHHHFLPRALKAIFQPNTLIEFPMINARPGRLIDDNFYDEFKEDFDSLDRAVNNKPQINVLLMGDNNIRTHAFKGGFRIYNTTKMIIDLHKDTRHPLLVLGVMPSPGTFAQTLPLSEFTDDILDKYVKAYHRKGQASNIAFATTMRFFSDSEGFLLYKTLFKTDGIHLNETGALQLALKILLGAARMADMLIQIRETPPK